MGRRKITVENTSESEIEIRKKDKKNSDTVTTTDSTVLGRQTRAKTMCENIASKNSDKGTATHDYAKGPEADIHPIIVSSEEVTLLRARKLNYSLCLD
ncbi:hypothetical protein Anas_12111 [Armadillidium nasatum]|uniref:Uncharacterized protein n=1 Tax=Armadillidium nasatum TaxID=96803 RepID=A0A5N5TCA6_9CRUS|nr:hypothetical protein Anas_12111 [Armadillidium nasatum]